MNFLGKNPESVVSPYVRALIVQVECLSEFYKQAMQYMKKVQYDELTKELDNRHKEWSVKTEIQEADVCVNAPSAFSFWLVSLKEKYEIAVGYETGDADEEAQVYTPVTFSFFDIQKRIYC